MTLLLHNIKVAWRNLMKYKLQTLISVLSIAVPAYLLLTRGFNVFMHQEVSESVHFSPVVPLLLGILTVIALIAVIVGSRIHRVMRTDPASIIAKE